MDALKALQERVSCSKLSAPAPSQVQREAIFRAALRAADHGNLRPWRFLSIEGEGLEALGQLYERAALVDCPDLNEAQRKRYRNMPLRAPLILVAIACHSEHPKVPAIEQTIAAGAAVQNMLTAAYAQGVGAYWRTGELAYNALVAEGLGLKGDEQIVGFIYLGTPEGRCKVAAEQNLNDFFACWPS